MIRELPESDGPVLGFEINGKVSLEEEREWIKKLEKAIGKHGRISVLVHLNEQARWGIDAGIADLKWIMTHMKKLDKIAVVSDSSIWKWLVSLDSPFAKLVGISEKHFELLRIEDAWSWVRE